MMEKKIKSSRDFIIHPGVIVRDVLEDRGFSQANLAARTGVSEAHISKIINGRQSISDSLAKALEYTLGVNAIFWMNLQTNYDAELMDYEQENDVSDDEIDILKQIMPVVNVLEEKGAVSKNGDNRSLVVQLRSQFGLRALTLIPRVVSNGAFRGAKGTSINIYVLYAWMYLCEYLTKTLNIKDRVDIDALVCALPQIKSIMFTNAGQIIPSLQSIFSECGIAFSVVQHFTGAPVQGCIMSRNDDSLMMALTIRRAYADIFWFTLFHEIGHIINNDIGATNGFIDYTFDTTSDQEKNADLFAANVLLDPIAYSCFVENKDYSISAINEFARMQNVQNYIIIGRLQKEKIISYSTHNQFKVKYIWCEKK